MGNQEMGRRHSCVGRRLRVIVRFVGGYRALALAVEVNAMKTRFPTGTQKNFHSESRSNQGHSRSSSRARRRSLDRVRHDGQCPTTSRDIVHGIFSTRLTKKGRPQWVSPFAINPAVGLQTTCLGPIPSVLRRKIRCHALSMLARLGARRAIVVSFKKLFTDYPCHVGEHFVSLTCTDHSVNAIC